MVDFGDRQKKLYSSTSPTFNISYGFEFLGEYIFIIYILDETLKDPASTGPDVVEMTVSLIEVRENRVFLTSF